MLHAVNKFSKLFEVLFIGFKSVNGVVSTMSELQKLPYSVAVIRSEVYINLAVGRLDDFMVNISLRGCYGRKIFYLAAYFEIDYICINFS